MATPAPAYKYNKGIIDRDSPKRFLGGADKKWLERIPEGDRRARLAKKLGDFMSNSNGPMYNAPLLETTTLHFGGPQLDADLTKAFGAQIDPLRKDFEGAVAVESTMADPSEFQVYYLIAGIQWAMVPDPAVGTALAASVTRPTSAGTKPVAPDDFTSQDLGEGGALTDPSLRPAILDWATWQEKAMYYMANAYDLEWQVGNRELLMNQKLSTVAFTPSNAQRGSASNSETDLEDLIVQTNGYYQSFLGSPRTLMSLDYTRYGHVFAGGVAGSVFHPTRNYKLMPTTYGAMGLQALLRGNRDIYRMAAPVVVPAGVKIGLHATLSVGGASTPTGVPSDQGLMLRYLSATYGNGGNIPANFADDPLFNAGAAATAAANETDLFTNTVQAVSALAGQDHWKGGPWKMVIGFFGAELRPDEVSMLRSPDYQTAIADEFGYKFPLWR